MKSSIVFVGVVCAVIIACAAAVVYFGYAAPASAGQVTAAGTNIPSGVELTPETVYGFATDKNKNGIPGAIVTIYNVKVVDTYPLSDGLADIADNPQTTATGSFAGFYVFEGLRPGFYNITAEKDGHMWFAIVNVTGSGAGGVEHGVALPDYKNPE